VLRYIEFGDPTAYQTIFHISGECIVKYRKLLLAAIIVVMIAISGISAALAAQKTFKIGLMLWINNDEFIAEMTKLGYVEGKNVSYVPLTFADVKPEDWQNGFKNQLQTMVDAKVDLLVTNTDTDAVNYRKAIGNIPVVFARSDNPVATGAVKDLVKPGGLATGIVTNRPHERRLQLLTEIKPTTKKVYYLYSTVTGDAEAVLKEVQNVAKGLGVEIVTGPFVDLPGLHGVLDKTPQDIDWIFLTPFVYPDEAAVKKLMDLSASRRAGLAFIINVTPKGYLMGYGPSLDDTSRQAARIVDRVLRGGNPADLPVETAENYLTINLEAAQAINLRIPEGILRQANLIVRPGYFDVTPTPRK
jgi:putative tryptophan/tyrosine transport system substrate-binding protein